MSSNATRIGRIVAPLISPNEPESQVVDLRVSDYAAIARGDVVCTLETSKSSVDVESEHDGFTGAVRVRVNDRVMAGELICEVFDGVPDREAEVADADDAERPAGLKLTRKAEALAAEVGLDLSALPTHRFLTERDIEALIAQTDEVPALDDALVARITENTVVIFGAGGFAKSLIDLMRSVGEYEPICVVDDDRDAARDVLGVPVIGGRAYLGPLRQHGLERAVNAVGSIGRIQTRIDIFTFLERQGFSLTTLVDPRASVAASAELGEGSQVFAAAVVASAARVGRGVIVNTGAIVSHDCTIGDYTHLAPGATLAGEVEVGEGTLVGMGVTVHVGLRIGSGAVIGNGSVLREDVPDGTIVSAGSLWPK